MLRAASTTRSGKGTQSTALQPRWLPLVMSVARPKGAVVTIGNSHFFAQIKLTPYCLAVITIPPIHIL